MRHRRRADDRLAVVEREAARLLSLRDHMKGLAAFSDDASLLGRQGFGVPRHQHHFGTALDRHAGSGQADAA